MQSETTTEDNQGDMDADDAKARERAAAAERMRRTRFRRRYCRVLFSGEIHQRALERVVDLELLSGADVENREAVGRKIVELATQKIDELYRRRFGGS